MGQKNKNAELAKENRKKGKKGTKNSTRVNDLRLIGVNLPKSATAFAGNNLRTENLKTNAKAPAKAGMHTVPTGSATDTEYSFYFPFTPQQIQYSNVGPELSEIQRPGKLPIIAFNRYRARQISLKILLAVPQDGLFTSVDESMDYLFAMANTARPVYFTNMDRQISNPLASTTSTSSPKIFWSIIDLNFSSTRRNLDNQVVVAEANLTLVENMNPIAKIADRPTIKYTEAPPQTPRSGNKPKETDYLTVTQVRQIINTDTRT